MHADSCAVLQSTACNVLLVIFSGDVDCVRAAAAAARGRCCVCGRCGLVLPSTPPWARCHSCRDLVCYTAARFPSIVAVMIMKQDVRDCNLQTLWMVPRDAHAYAITFTCTGLPDQECRPSCRTLECTWLRTGLAESTTCMAQYGTAGKQICCLTLVLAAQNW